MVKKSANTESIPEAPRFAVGMMTDFITGQPVKEMEKERVRQEVARQFLYLIFAKMYDEWANHGPARKFFALASEPFTEEGRLKISERGHLWRDIRSLS